MIHGVDSITSMNRELKLRVQSAGMQFDCGCGGVFNSSITVVSEAPGVRETQLREPLVGGSGKLLWECLRREKLGRNHVYITNVVKRQLVSADEQYARPKAPISQSELDHWRGILQDELSILPNCKYILALGNYALNALTGETGITAHRGSVYDIVLAGRPFKVICAYNPAFIIREPKLEITFKMDLHKLTRVMDGSYSVPLITELINPSYDEALRYIEKMHDDKLAIAYDIETMAGETACVGLSNSAAEGMCINWRTQKEHRFSAADERNIRIALQRLFADTTSQFIAQNGNFDAYWLWYKDRIKVHANWFDTLLAHHLLYPPLPHNLGYITSQYTDYPYYKDEGKDWREDGDIDGFWRYNVKDCVVTRLAAFKMLGELRTANMEQFFFNHVMKLQPHLVRMTVGGVLADGELKQRFVEELTIGVAQARELCIAEARVATGIQDYDFNPRSVPDLGNLYFRDLKLVGRGASTDAENRDRMLKHPRTSEPAKRVLHAIERYVGEAKFLSTYANSRLGEDGRFRCEYKQTGVQSAPGRLSSSSLMDGQGLNLQNIPERGKPMFIADPGFELTYFDAAQIEARFVAVLAKIEIWLEQFELARVNPGSYDAHRALASVLFKVPYDDVPVKDFTADGKPTIRYIAKRCRHGLNYRMGPDRLATTAGLSIREAEDNWRLYHREFPEIREWWDATVADVRRDRMLHSPLGRRWVLMERFDENALDSIIAFKPQSTAGDHIASVIYKAENDPRWPADEARVILNVHDALITLNTPRVGRVVRSILREHAEAPVYINGTPMVVPADFAVSQAGEDGLHRWSSMKKVARDV